MFGRSSDEAMPDSFLTDHEVWDRFVGGVWASLLRAYDAGSGGVAVEFAPGNSIKLGVALSEIGFRGVLYVVDASAAALEALKPKYRALLPDADLRFICGLINETQLPSGIDLLIGNHIVDDMILSEGERRRGENHSFGWAAAYTHQPSNDVRRSWQELTAQQGLRGIVETAVAENLLQAMAGLSPKLTIFSQYPSATLSDHDLQALNDSAVSVLERIKTAMSCDDVQPVLDHTGNFGNHHIGMHLLNARYWLLCRQP